jgi:signal peptidase I
MLVINLLFLVLSYLAVPVILIALYDHYILAPRRPRNAEGQPVPGHQVARIANFMVPFVLIGVVFTIGGRQIFAWLREIALPLAWAALPVGLWCAIDSWLLAPRRQIRAKDPEARDPAVMRFAYTILPALVLAVIVRMISAESLDFSLVLLVLSVATGIVWGIDHLAFRKRREAAAAAVTPPVTLREPGTVDYARSFFPVAFIVLIVRAFIFEPFRIPSDSMMPTLLDGDFIAVNKYAYGLRLPVLNKKFIDIGSPQRGDVVVFRWPPNPSVNYIKRLVGLPGDRIEVRDDHLVINGEVLALNAKGRFVDKCYMGFNLWSEKIGEHTHDVMTCSSSSRLHSANAFGSFGRPESLPACDRKKINEDYGGAFVCDGSLAQGPDNGNHVFEQVVPPGHYLMIGDNRDNSEDGRAWGLVPEENLVGKATRIWLNFDPNRTGGNMVNLKRIGTAIE